MSSIIANKKDFYQLANNRFKFQLFLLARLPAAYIAGVKIENCNEESCSVSVPFKWLTKNPFRSTYFACLSMAAEMSTGALAMANLYKRTPAASMLITSVESKYYKKATGKTTFICQDGRKIRASTPSITWNHSLYFCTTNPPIQFFASSFVYNGCNKGSPCALLFLLEY